jgi:hypothetical protein
MKSFNTNTITNEDIKWVLIDLGYTTQISCKLQEKHLSEVVEIIKSGDTKELTYGNLGFRLIADTYKRVVTDS